jgi:HK97 family phage portal protein
VALARRLATSLQQSDPRPARDTTWFRETFFSGRTESVEVITVEDALGIDAVWAAVRVRAWGVGKLPLLNYRRIGPSQGELLDAGPAARVFARPNPEQAPMNFFGLLGTHLNTWGDSFVAKEFELLRPNVVRHLWPWHPKHVRVARKNGEKLFYLSDPESGVEDPDPYTQSEFIHVMGLSLDGLRGLSPIGQARESLGTMRARERSANRFWRDGAIPSGLLSTDKELEPPAVRRLERDWNRKYKGKRRTAVLESGLKYQPLMLPLEDAQFVESEELSVRKVARWFDLPPSAIAGSTGDSMTYKTVEGDLLRLLSHLHSDLALIEQAFGHDLDLYPIKPGQARSAEYPEFDVTKMLRTDAKTRAEYLSLATGGRAWMHPSEARVVDKLSADETLDDLTTNPAGSSKVSPTSATPRD